MLFLFGDGPLARRAGGGLADRFISPEMKQKIAETRNKVNELIQLEKQEVALLQRLERALRGGR